MKLQVIIEILVLCALVAFAAGRVIDSRDFQNQEFTSRLISNVTKNVKHRQNEIVVTGSDYDDPVGSQEISVGEEDLIAATNTNNNVPADSATNSVAIPVSASTEDNNVSLAESDNTEAPVNIDDAHPLNRYCTCNDAECNCCREFKLPLVSVRGPGCASLRYLGKNRMSIAIKYGDITLTSRTISGRKARPVCLNLPGGFSQFCGRIYGINREEDDFQACLGLELRAEEEVEAALRVSCFKFGPKGLKMTDPQPLPPVAEAVDDDDEEGGGLLSLVTGGGDSEEDYEDEEEEEEEVGAGQDAATGDEDTDLLGFADDDEEDDDDDSDEDAEDLDDDEDDEAAAPVDYPSGFSLLDGIFGDAPNKKKKPVQTRNKVNTVAEDVKVEKTQVGAKVKIPNSPAILNSASLSQNEIDNTIPKDSAASLDPVDLAPAAAVAEAVKPVADEKPKPAESSVITELQSNAGVPLVSTTPKPKKKPSTSLLDTLESFISGGDDDDDDDEEEDNATKDDETDDDDEEEDEDEAVEDEKEEEPEEEEAEEAEDDDEEEDDEDEKEAEDDEDEEEEPQQTNDKEAVTKAGEKKPKKKSPFGLGFFARLMKFI